MQAGQDHTSGRGRLVRSGTLVRLLCGSRRGFLDGLTGGPGEMTARDGSVLANGFFPSESVVSSESESDSISITSGFWAVSVRAGGCVTLVPFFCTVPGGSGEDSISITAGKSFSASTASCPSLSAAALATSASILAVPWWHDLSSFNLLSVAFDEKPTTFQRRELTC